VAVAVLLVGAAAGGYVYLGGGAGGAPTGMVVQALELSTNSDLEVLQVEDRGSLDRVVLSDGSTVINAYVTEDRKYLVQATSNGQVVQGFVPLRNLTRTLQARNSFISCLDRRNATFYGVASNNRTLAPYTRSMQAQLQVLGGQQALQLFGGVGPRQIQRLVFDYNRTRGIVWQVNGSLSGGVHTIPMLQQRSGCTLGVDTGPYG
ncbi:MAG: hypothetical protein SVU88_03095, partial [Candidatus Nanohaloarchaea archaeon]|nr:hypothetical protein [Candidatus Nanohaloarchaea archaeon]